MQGLVDLEAKSNQLSSAATTGGLDDRVGQRDLLNRRCADVDVCTLKPSFSGGKLLPSSLDFAAGSAPTLLTSSARQVE